MCKDKYLQFVDFSYIRALQWVFFSSKAPTATDSPSVFESAPAERPRRPQIIGKTCWSYEVFVLVLLLCQSSGDIILQSGDIRGPVAVCVTLRENFSLQFKEHLIALSDSIHRSVSWGVWEPTEAIFRHVWACSASFCLSLRAPRPLAKSGYVFPNVS